MADRDQRGEPSETQISVDLNAADPTKAVTRRSSADLGREARDGQEGGRTKAEKDLFKRMNRLERNLGRQFDQKMAEQQAAHQREIAAMQERLKAAGLDRDGAADAADEAHQAAMKKLEDALAAAYERGDSVETAKITRQMSELDGKYWAKKAQSAGVTTRESTTTQPPAAGNQNRGPTVAGSRFIKANADWWEDPDFNVETAAANAIYIDLVNNQGFDPKDDETFKEVGKQLKAKFPSLAVKAGRRGADPDDDETDDEEEEGRPERQETRRNAASGRFEDRGAGDGRSRGGPRILTALEIKTMRDCRLDPDNDRDVAQFVREAQALEEAAR